MRKQKTEAEQSQTNLSLLNVASGETVSSRWLLFLGGGGLGGGGGVFLLVGAAGLDLFL